MDFTFKDKKSKEIDFSISLTDKSPKMKKVDKRKGEKIDMHDRYLERSAEMVTHQVSDISKIGLPKKDRQLRLITIKTFNTIAFIKHISEIEKITECRLAIYSISKYPAELLVDMIKGVPTKIVMSSLQNGAYDLKKQVVNDILLDQPNIKLIFATSHAKVTAIKTKDNFYVIEGSGNMSNGSRIEQYVFDNSELVYNFHKEWIDSLEELLKGKKEYTKYNGTQGK